MKIYSRWKLMRKDKIVLTTGCFDLFHTGHLSLLKYCKSLGQYLIVGINSDDYVRATKGKNRPIIGENDRLKIIQSIKYVDFAYVFNSKSAVSEIQLIRPDIFVMNSESIKLFPEEVEAVVNSGGKIGVYDKTNNISTTNIIKVIKGENQC